MPGDFIPAKPSHERSPTQSLSRWVAIESEWLNVQAYPPFEFCLEWRFRAVLFHCGGPFEVSSLPDGEAGTFSTLGVVEEPQSEVPGLVASRGTPAESPSFLEQVSPAPGEVR